MTPLQILYVAQNYLPMNASSITIHGVMKRLAEKGHNITLIAPQRCPKKCTPLCTLGCKDNTEFTVLRVPTFVPHYVLKKHRNLRAFVLTLSHLLLILKGVQINKAREFNLVLSQHHGSHLASFSAFILSRTFGLPLFVRTHDVYDTPSNIVDSLYLHTLDSLYRVILKRADYVFVVSSPLRSMLIKTHQLKEDRVLVFPNGVDTRQFRPDIECHSLRQALQVEGKKILLFIGSVVESRGLMLLVKALPAIVSENPNIVVLVVGDGPQKTDLKESAQQLGVERSLRFVQPVDHSEVAKFVCISDVAIGPLKARTGTFGSVPRKVLEYMACAKPTITCYGSVSQDLIIDGYNGFLIYPRIEDLVSTILRVVNQESLVAEVGSNARRDVENMYDWDKIINDFDEILRATTTGSGNL